MDSKAAFSTVSAKLFHCCVFRCFFPSYCRKGFHEYNVSFGAWKLSTDYLCAISNCYFLWITAGMPYAFFSLCNAVQMLFTCFVPRFRSLYSVQGFSRSKLLRVFSSAIPIINVSRAIFLNLFFSYFSSYFKHSSLFFATFLKMTFYER